MYPLLKKIALPCLPGFLVFASFLISCRSEPPAGDPLLGAAETIMDLKVVNGPGRMRDTPAATGKIIRQFVPGTSLKDLGGVSDQTTQISYGSKKFDEPWLQVQDSIGQTGWIYAREVAPLDPLLDIQDFRRQKQLQSIFGSTAYQRLQYYQSIWEEARTDEQVAELYRNGLNLRDTLVLLLEKKSYNYQQESLPDLFWMESRIPAYVLQLVAEGTVYYLFNDYEQWLDLAKESKGRQDDRFFDLMVRCFPQDSIEYFYPAWELQTWDYGGHNLLGRGITYEILAGIEQIQAQTPLFAKELDQIKDQVLADVTRPNIHFWEPDSLVKQELDAIIQANWGIFTLTDQIALDTRRLQLDSAAVHRIQFNARAGE